MCEIFKVVRRRSSSIIHAEGVIFPGVVGKEALYLLDQFGNVWAIPPNMIRLKIYATFFVGVKFLFINLFIYLFFGRIWSSWNFLLASCEEFSV